ncbi:MAG: 4-alpha-glucanotransferase [Mogibacterium sp.]|nr:4-alpha-glucanotransferase [Mogibacterium sp.]
MRVFHNSRIKTFRDPFGAVEVGTSVSLSIDVAEANIEGVRLMVWRGEELSPAYHDMNDTGNGRYSVIFTAPDEGCLLWYTFEIKAYNDSGDCYTVYYGNNHEGMGGEGCLYEYSPNCYQITVYRKDDSPGWYKEGIVYQIFPDRFARDADWKERIEDANKSVNERRTDIKRTVQEDWTRQAYYVRDESGKVIEWPMYGGSLRGIEEKLDYLKSLGVSVIYLNPIFEATSNHRYDTADYMHIDPALGTDEDFRQLVKSARAKGIRLILDGVFSHTGSDSLYFDKYGNYPNADGNGAWNNENSPYRSWYKFDENEEIGYKSWWGVRDLPEVDENDEGYRNFINGADGVVAHWLSMGADGWRLDVADELPDSFIREVRKRIDESSEGALLIGEVWEDASNKTSYDERREYLLGEELHGCMNYPLRAILLDYINYTISASHAAEKLRSLQENYPRERFYSNLNLIGTHDRDRIITAMAGEEDYESAVRKVRMISTLQYALPGVPCIYYGDEVGLMGGADPANRSGYPWGFENLDLGYHYRMLGLIYEEHPALKDGSLTILSGRSGIPEDVFAFVREGYGEKILILANRSYGESVVSLRASDEVKCGYALELLKTEELPVFADGILEEIRMERLSAKIICLRDRKPEAEGFERAAGLICHLSSLPQPLMGKPAKDFVDFIASAGFKIWQILPLNPPGTGGSPYSSHSAFAGDTRFINRAEMPDNADFQEFINKNDDWLTEYAAYTVIKESQGLRSWLEWQDEYRLGNPRDMFEKFSPEQRARTDELIYEQYVFEKQWRELKEYANSKGVSIMGDLPMFMAADSADVWANRDVFRLEDDGRFSVHAGVPPDAFTGEGQDWGNPLYDWEKSRAEGHRWWMRRIKQCAERFDMLRIDHFRGLSEYFAIPEGGSPSEGYWQHGPGLGLFKAIDEMLEAEGLSLKILAEDLGYLDDGVKCLLRQSGLPGMDIWQFTAHEMLALTPEPARKRAFYTGTHDNDTLMGFVRGYMGSPADEGKEHEGAAAEASDDAELSHEGEARLRTECERIIKEIYASNACLAMLQIQDVFMLGSEARMNVPGVPEGNWTWKIPGRSVWEAFPDADERAAWFRDLASETGR